MQFGQKIEHNTEYECFYRILGHSALENLKKAYYADISTKQEDFIYVTRENHDR
jgi:hypothetical protein